MDQITVTAGRVRKTATGAEGGVDVSVAVTLDDRAVSGEVTLCPAEDGRPVYEAWGDCAECWVSGALLSAIYDAAGESRGEVLRGMLDELSAVAGRAAGRPS